MATETSNSFGDVGALKFALAKGWILENNFLYYRKIRYENKN